MLKQMKQPQTFQKGFVLPMIMVTGSILLIVLSFGLQTMMVSRDVLINQRYQLLARQAAESGLARAYQCLKENDQIITWSEEKPLKPNTDCHGNVITSADEYIVKNGRYQSSFKVSPINFEANRNIASFGTIELFRGGTTDIFRRYHYVTSDYMKTNTTLSFDNDIAFGSYYDHVVSIYGTEYKYDEVFFFTKTINGDIAAAGSNINEVLKSGMHALPFYVNQVTPRINYESVFNRIFINFQGNGARAYFLRRNSNGVDNIYSSGGTNMGADSARNLPNNESIERIFPNGMVGFILSTDHRFYGFGWNMKDRSYVGCHKNCPSLTDKVYAKRIVFCEVDSHGNCNPDSDGTIDRKVSAFSGGTTLKQGAAYNQYDKTTTNCAVSDGSAYCWGSNHHKQISADNRIAYSLAYPVAYYNSHSSTRVIDVKTDGETVYVLLNNGKVYARGYNQYGQAGCELTKSVCENLTEIKFPAGTKIFKMAVASYSALFMGNTGGATDVYGVGLNDVGQLGHTSPVINGRRLFTWGGDAKRFELPAGKRPVSMTITAPALYSADPVATPRGVMAYESRAFHNSYVITSEGEVYGAGSNRYGQLGVGRWTTHDSHNSPQSEVSYYTHDADVMQAQNSIDSVTSTNPKPLKMYLVAKDKATNNWVKLRAKDIRSSLGTTVVITEDNLVFTVGRNHQGQLGSRDTINRYVPHNHALVNQWSPWHY